MTFKGIGDLFFPRHCRICGEELKSDEELICGHCEMEAPRTFYWESPYDNPMARRFWGRFPLERAAGWIHYKSHSPVTQPVMSIKYYDAPVFAEDLGEIVARDFKKTDFFDGIDVIVPVPLTMMRKMNRGYNQADRVANGVSKATGIPVSNFAVRRTKFRESQTTLSHDQRGENVEDSFSQQLTLPVAGKHVLVVDDVVTTGSTVSFCAEELCKEGAVLISVLSVGVTKLI